MEPMTRTPSVTPSAAPSIEAGTTLNEIIVRHPGAQPVLAAHGFDTCCGGALPLDEVARRHGVALTPLLDELRKAASGTGTPSA